jgi:hypothetical protein
MSYTLYTNTLTRSNTNAEFQNWGKQISDAIANCGIIKESDANVGTQIDWSTVAAPSAAHQSRGYEIYKFNDAIQATTPVYFKLEYGSGATAPVPALWLTVGSGANTSGNVTGNTTTRQQITSATATSNVSSYYSGANGRFVMSFAAGGTVSQHMMIALERILDGNGAATSAGLAILLAHTVNRFQTLWTLETGNVTAFETNFGVLTPGSGMNSGLLRGQSGEHLAAYPLVFFKGAVVYPPQTILMSYFNGEFTTGVSCEMPVYGANVNYMPLGNTCCYGVSERGGNKTAWMMRWD